MDPLTALSVATSVVSFVDFGSKLLSKSRKLYKSSNGVLTENVDLQIIALDIATLAQGLRRKLPEHRPLSNTSKGLATFEDDGALDDMCRRCVEIASELMVQLDKLKVDAPSAEKDKKNKKNKKAGNGAVTEDKNDSNDEKEENETKDEKDKNNEKASNEATNVSVKKALRITLPTSGPLASKTQGRIPLSFKNTINREFPLFRSWKSFQKALEASWKRQEIEDLAATLRDFRGEIEFRMLLMFRGSLNDLAAQQAHTSRELAQATGLILDASFHTRESLTHQLQQQAERLLQVQELQERGTTRNIQRDENFYEGTLGRVGNFETPRLGEDAAVSDTETCRKDQQIQEELRLLMVENGILESLSFVSSADRQQSVEMPHRDTFEWIFDDDSGTSERRWSSLTEWLRTGSGIYWINGKVGSGKSTLMKYICENSRTAEELKQWAAGMPLEVSAFFFWNSGDENQKSQRGLLKSLLHDILGRHRDLLPIILRDAWDAWSLRAASMINHNTLPKGFSAPPEPAPWTLARLKRAFADLIHHLHLQRKVKLCLFIDGMDEYSGDHTDLIDLFRGFARFPNLKLCVSSRPLLAFCTAFEELPGLRLQDLTEPDISQYVHDHLGGGRKISSSRYSIEARALEKDIVAKAQGVFLWVKLVVRSLTKGISDYTRISDLRRRVDHLPGDLEALYAHMLTNVTEKSYHEQASQIFQIVQAVRRTSTGGISLLRLSWAEDEDFDLAESVPIRPITQDQILERCEVMDARLKSICVGLLESVNPQYSEIAPDAKVVFLHRTVYDWISKPHVWDGIIRHTAGSDFSPNLCMLRSCILQLKAFGSSVSPLDMAVVTDAMAYARAAEADVNCGFPKLLDQLDVVVSYHWRASNANAQHRGSYASRCNEADFFKDSDLDSDEEEDIVGNTRRIEEGLKVMTYENRLQHWSYGVEIPGIKTIGESSTFFDLAKDLGLSHYVATKDRTGGVVDQDVSVHILHHALSELSVGTPDPCLIQEILAAGTDPNLAYCGITPWEAALTRAASQFSARHSPNTGNNLNSRTWEQNAEAWANILEVFLKHGVDPTQVVKPRQVLIQGPSRLSPARVVDMLPETLASKSAELKALLSSSSETWKRRTGDARKRTVTFSEDVLPGTTVGSAGSVGAREELNKARVASAVGWLGWVVSWLPG